MKNEYGRSMIEMLGVLAIIGVLSIGGLAGYTMAMNRHRANQILDFVSRCAVASQTYGDGYYIGKVTTTYDSVTGAPTISVSDGTCYDFLQLEADGVNGIKASEFKVASAGPEKNIFTVVTPSLGSQELRLALINRANSNVQISSGSDCKVTFTFRK